MFSFLVGLLVPRPLSGRMYLKRSLGTLGVDCDRIPPGCLKEIVSDAAGIAAIARLVSNESEAALFIRNLDGAAVVVANHVFADGVVADHIVSILERYGVERGALVPR